MSNENNELATNKINQITLQQRAARIAQDENNILLHEVIDAANKKFDGEVVRANKTGANEWTLIIKRKKAIFGPDRCFMRIRGAADQEGRAYFYWGHYDLTENDAYKN